MTKRNTSRSAPASSRRRRSGINQAEFGRHVDLSQQRVSQLVETGTISTMADGKIDPDVGRIQYIRTIRRSPGSEELRRVTAARAEAIEIQNQKQLHQLIPVAEVEFCLAEIITVFCGELAGVPAASSRDVEQREATQRALDAAIGRCKSRLDRLASAARSGRPLGDAEGEDDAQDND